MMTGVMLKGALKSGYLVVMPLDTDFVKPEAEDIKRFCMRQLSSFYPQALGVQVDLAHLLVERKK